MPPGLSETYECVLDRIAAEDFEIAKIALIWLSCCKRPLSLGDLGIATAIVPGAKAFDEENRLDNDEMLQEILGPLITVNRETSIVNLAHFSVREYLNS